MPEYPTPGLHVEETDAGDPPTDGGPIASPRHREHERVYLNVPTMTVSLAVHLVEGATGGKPVEMPEVSVEGVDEEPIPKSDRFLLYLDVELPDPPSPAVVSVDGGDRYRDATHQVVVTDNADLAVPAQVEVFPPSRPAVTVWLFEENATVLRGYVRDTDGDRIGGGELGVTDLGLSAEIDSNGRFVLYFEDPPDDVVAQLEIDDLDDAVGVPLSVAEGSETVHTLEVDVAAGTVTVHEDII